VQDHHSKFFVVRTSWVFGEHGHNFVKTMLRVARERDEISVVSDQIGSPTYAADLAERIFSLVSGDHYGIYHVTNSGHCSWYEFAQAIFEEAGISVRTLPLLSQEYPQAAARPAYSVLEPRDPAAPGGQSMRHWRESLRDCVRKLHGGEAAMQPDAG